MDALVVIRPCVGVIRHESHGLDWRTVGANTCRHLIDHFYSDLKAAELILAHRIEEVRQATIFGVRPQRTFREAATKFLEENGHLRSLGDYALHLKQLDPYIVDLPLERVHLGSLQVFIKARKRAGIKNRSINLALATVRRVLNLAARLWRDEAGLTWLETPPLIQMLPLSDARKPYPLSWYEQRKLFSQNAETPGPDVPVHGQHRMPGAGSLSTPLGLGSPGSRARYLGFHRSG